MFGHENLNYRPIFVGVLPRQNGVPGQHAVAQRIETSEFGAGGIGPWGLRWSCHC